MEPHDVVLAKCVTGRERDREFAREALRHGVVDAEELLRRVAGLAISRSRRERIARLLRSLAAAEP